MDYPKWKVNKVIDYLIHYDFKSIYGDDFAFLGKHTPDSVIVATVSTVSVDWKRTSFFFHSYHNSILKQE